MQTLLTEKGVSFVVDKRGHKRAVQISYKAQTQDIHP
jgi:hypothetical protein